LTWRSSQIHEGDLIGKESEMANRLWGVAILAGMVLAQTPSLRADDTLLPNGNTVPFKSQAGQANAPGQAAATAPLTPQALQGWPAGGAPASFTQPRQGQWPPAAGSQPGPPVGQAQVVAPANGLARLPSTAIVSPIGAASGPVLPVSSQAVDGTYRDDGDYVTITIDGKETKLIKPRSMAPANIPGVSTMGEGTVRGRLMQSGRPLANCRVVIVPLVGDAKSYRYDTNREPISTIADNEGIYTFDHVPAGKYKLTWLPIGTNQWIRRVAIKPDVVVHPGQAANINTIGAAQRTIN
jgi:hypothetical protein